MSPSPYCLRRMVLFLPILLSCMQAPTNPIYRDSPETYFPTQPALAVAKVIRANDVAALDQLFAQHPDLDANQPGQKGVTFLL